MNAPKLPRPFEVIFNRIDAKKRTVCVPNLSVGFSVIAAAVMRKLGFKAIPLPMAGARAKELGKKFVHNDMCYPAQINIGEALAWLEAGKVPPSQVAIALAKNCADCRAGQYSALARKALDEAGYPDVAIVTTGTDTKKMHPGFKMGLRWNLYIVWGIIVTDALHRMLLSVRPYENIPGSADILYDKHLHAVSSGLEKSTQKCLQAFRHAVDEFNFFSVKKEVSRPRCFVIGEILMNYHDSANGHVVRYLEKHGFEVLLPDIVTFFWRSVVADRDRVKRGMAKNPLLTTLVSELSDCLYSHIFNRVDKIYKKFTGYHKGKTVNELADQVKGFVDISIMAGEGWLVPAEIMSYAQDGVSAFLIIQPFGCMPNQVTGRGLIGSLKEKFPHIHILPIDYDADTSQANIENRLQMLIMSTRPTGNA